jgi:SAM-dependent methyltransferase
VRSVDLNKVLVRVATSRPGVRLRHLTFKGSGRYWEDRYAAGGNSGPGSYGRSAEWKAEVVNQWVRELGITSVVDLGCGDGNQLSLADYPRYLGLDRSATAIRRCIDRFKGDPTKSFLRYEPDELADPAGWLRADLALSMEVIFHLVEDEVFEDYMRRLFASAERYIVICSNDTSGDELVPHERHRSFTAWIARECAGWQLAKQFDPPDDTGLMSSLYLYSRTTV